MEITTKGCWNDKARGAQQGATQEIQKARWKIDDVRAFEFQIGVTATKAILSSNTQTPRPTEGIISPASIYLKLFLNPVKQRSAKIGGTGSNTASAHMRRDCSCSFEGRSVCLPSNRPNVAPMVERWFAEPLFVCSNRTIRYIWRSSRWESDGLMSRRVLVQTQPQEELGIHRLPVVAQSSPSSDIVSRVL
eukprot:scaffold1943_cov160-Amphora_coffeaeformis.AAC.7